MSNNRVIFLITLISLPFTIWAQELNCNVIINAEQVQTQERQIFDQMQAAITNFMNTTQWTEDEFAEKEKIECNLLLTLGKESTVTNFSAVAQVQSSRPVYGTDYNSPVLNFNDNKWVFTYNPSDPLYFQENTFTTQLTSLLAYYAYIIIGLDYDSFSPKGGAPYYERALNILNNSQDTGPGWGQFDDTRDRYWIIENLNDPQFEPFRTAIYDYHRKAMDNFEQEPIVAQRTVLDVLYKLKEVREIKPLAVMINNFFDTKGQELISVFAKADTQLKLEAVEVMSELDPTQSSTYKKILK